MTSPPAFRGAVPRHEPLASLPGATAGDRRSAMPDRTRRGVTSALLLTRWPALIGSPLVAAPGAARAGAQVEEPIANAVRSAMSAAVAESAPPRPSFDRIETRIAYLRWLGEMSQRLKKRKAEDMARIEFLETAWYESTRAGLEPSLLLGVIQVESGFRKYAISSAGARGYAQVMPFWARLIGNAEPRHLFHMQTNLRFGCVILRHYLDREGGDLFLALGRYNGSRGRPEYPAAVFASQRAWVYTAA
jgi:soluble lytic murein transglycosylase-like protein